MKLSRLDTNIKEHSSDFHKLFYSYYLSSFPLNKIYQEYPLSKILEYSYKLHSVPIEVQNSYYLKCGNRLFVDVVDFTLQIAFELQGDHHNKIVVRSDKETEQSASLKFEAQKRNDKLKKKILKEAKFKLVEIDYKDKDNLLGDFILNKIMIIKNE